MTEKRPVFGVRDTNGNRGSPWPNEERKGECDISKNDTSLIKPLSFISPISNNRLVRGDLDFGVHGMGR